MNSVKLIALDIDGTLYNKDGVITSYNKEMIRKTVENGITVIISTGRPYIGLPVDEMKELGIQYAITANGSAVYRVPEKELLLDESMDTDLSVRLLRKLYTQSLHIDAFINGDGYTQFSTSELTNLLDIPDSLKKYIQTTRKTITDLAAYIEEHKLCVSKLTLNFAPDADGSYTTREKTKEILDTFPEVTYVSGGFHNLEVTRCGIAKSKGLKFLCDYLHISMEDTMAVGDSENDLDIVKAAGIGVAMGNAQQLLKDSADFISLSNEEDGVVYARTLYILYIYVVKYSSYSRYNLFSYPSEVFLIQYLDHDLLYLQIS